MTRQITKLYQDPVDIIWLQAAEQCGIQVVRDAEVFAAWDGERTLRIGTADTLDPDDSLAQMIFHELCHAVVAGPESFAAPDWGLNYDNREHRVFEEATLRLQAALADEYHLRNFFASTTDFRNYYDSLSADPLQDEHDPATLLARNAMRHFAFSSWRDPIRDGLRRTRAIAATVSDIAGSDSIWANP